MKVKAATNAIIVVHLSVFIRHCQNIALLTGIQLSKISPREMSYYPGHKPSTDWRDHSINMSIEKEQK